MRLVTLDEIDSDGETINTKSKIWEISGLTHNNNKDYPMIYGTSDTIIWPDHWSKSIYIFDIHFDSSSITPIESTNNKNETYYTVYGIELQDPDYQQLYGSDTENIVYFEDKFHNNTQYFIIMTEGWRQFHTTAVWLYDYTGCWLGNLTLNLAVFEMRYNGTLSNEEEEEDDDDDNFQETWGFADGFGVESLSITSDFSTAIFIVSGPLVQDSQFCDTCVSS